MARVGYARAMRALVLLLLVLCSLACKRSSPAPVVVTPKPPDGPCSDADVEVVRIEECEARCAEGVARACAVGARKYWGGTGVKQSTRRVVELGERGCALGSSDACALVSSAASGAHDGIDGTFHDPERERTFGRKAFPLLLTECDAGDSHACENAGYWLTLGNHVDKDPARAAALTARAKAMWKAGCDAGQGFLCWRLALDLSVDGKDEAGARRLWLRGCELGHAQSCEDASHGAGDAEELRLLGKACELGHARACKSASLFATLDQDDARAQRLLERSCELRNAEACSQLADELRARDAGVLADEAMRQACALGSVLCPKDTK